MQGSAGSYASIGKGAAGKINSGSGKSFEEMEGNKEASSWWGTLVCSL